MLPALPPLNHTPPSLPLLILFSVLILDKTAEQFLGDSNGSSM